MALFARLGLRHDESLGDGLMYQALVERNGLFPGQGYTLRVNRKSQTGKGSELTAMTWGELDDGNVSTCYVGDADAGGDLMAFLNAVVDAAWIAGVRPSCFMADNESAKATIDSLQKHIEDLKRQVSMQHSTIEKLLAK